MQSVVISRLLQRPCSLTALVCFGLLLLLYVLAPGGQRHLQQPGAGEPVKLQEEVVKLWEEAVKMREEAVKMREQISAQNETIKKLRPQMDKLQGNLQHCQAESGKHGQLVQGLEDRLEDCQQQNSNLRHGCQGQSCKSQDNNLLWYILAFLGVFLVIRR